MDDNHLTHAVLQQSAGSMAQRDGVKLAIRRADIESGGFARLEFVEDTEIDVFQSRANNLREALAVFADNIDAGFHACGLRLGQ